MNYAKKAISISMFTIYCTFWAISSDEVIARWKKGGVIFEQPQFVVIEESAQVGSHTTIGCGVHILGNSSIGKSCNIGHYAIINNCTIGDNVTILSHCVLEHAVIEDGAQIGPFAHIEEQTHIKQDAVIGNFVEVKRSTIGEGTKAKHLSYLGDLTTEPEVNIGAGTICCNYNGVSKHKTYVGQKALIGSNTNLIAPVTVGKGAMTAAGSTITKNIPADALAIARCKEQINKPNYAPKLRKRYLQKKADREKKHERE